MLQPMEEYGQRWGLILYRTWLPRSAFDKPEARSGAAAAAGAAANPWTAAMQRLRLLAFGTPATWGAAGVLLICIRQKRACVQAPPLLDPALALDFALLP